MEDHDGQNWEAKASGARLTDNQHTRERENADQTRVVRNGRHGVLVLLGRDPAMAGVGLSAPACTAAIPHAVGAGDGSHDGFRNDSGLRRCQSKRCI